MVEPRPVMPTPRQLMLLARRYRKMLYAIGELHDRPKHGDRGYCTECGFKMPCKTKLLVEEALHGNTHGREEDAADAEGSTSS